MGTIPSLLYLRPLRLLLHSQQMIELVGKMTYAGNVVAMAGKFHALLVTEPGRTCDNDGGRIWPR